jgi:hypothetical protein
VRELCQGGLPPNRTVEYPKIGNNKMAVDEICEGKPHRWRTLVAKVGTTAQANKQLLEAYHSYHGNPEGRRCAALWWPKWGPCPKLK